MALDGNGRWAYLDPKLGAMHAVAEAARKVACTGATPVAATNCLNFGNPEKPEIMAQLSAAIDGIAEACTALGTPITGGNVSLYNETRGEGIYPTPVLGIVGILEDVTKAVPASFQREKDAIVLLWPIPRGPEPDPKLKVPFKPLPISPYIVYPLTPTPAFPVASPLADPVLDDLEDTTEPPGSELEWFGSSEFAKAVLGSLWGTPPALDLDGEADLHNLLAVLAWRKLIRSARDVSDGGIAVALAQAAFTKGIGATVEQDPSLLVHPLFGLFAEPASTIIVTTEHSNLAEIDAMANQYNFLSARIGTTGGNRLEILVDGETFISAPLAELRTLWASALEANLHDEVPA
jgi:phosphoribosylformylglycinamidine synthase